MGKSAVYHRVNHNIVIIKKKKEKKGKKEERNQKYNRANV